MTWNTWQKQIKAQDKAKDEARKTGKPVKDGYGNIWHPPGKDGLYICQRDKEFYNR